MNNPVKEILIIGLGLIGSSIAMASRSKGIVVHGFDINEAYVTKALEEKIIDGSFSSIKEINNKDLIGKVDLIIVSVSPKNTQDVINELDVLWNSDITITDTASVKNHLRFPSSSNIVLSHPIAGSDKSGIEAGIDDLFIGKKNVICNPFNADQYHVDRLKDFWKHALQMRVSEMSVKDHDILFAVTSHLPHLISYALIDSIRLSATNVEDNAGGGLKEFIRLSGSNPEMWSEIFELNGMKVRAVLPASFSTGDMNEDGTPMIVRDYMGFSWNPGLKRISDYRLLNDGYTGMVREHLVDQWYRDQGFIVVSLSVDDNDGYVKHIGWDRRAGDPGFVG